MRYNDIEELPAAIRKNLPKDAMEVYLVGYNQALARSVKVRVRIGTMVLDTAHQKAWSAVCDKYPNRGGEWIRYYT
jgi:cation transport regulator ChaB